MTSTTEHNGRLGNQIIRNLAVSLVAEKHNLKVTYSNNRLIKKLGIKLFTGNNEYKRIEKITDDNYFTIYNCNNLNYNLDPNDSYFQSTKITKFLYNYLHTDKIKSSIIKNNPFKERYTKNNDIFIHIRLTDAELWNPGITYYVKTIKQIGKYDNLYISTDDKNHPIVIELFKLYPSAKLIEYDEINTFQFASTCKNIILSHGSFSAIIGYLSFFSNVYYHEYELNKIWYGDMFSIQNWNKITNK
jgi:hypothetical protein